MGITTSSEGANPAAALVDTTDRSDAKCNTCGESLGNYYVVVEQVAALGTAMPCSVTKVENDLFGAITIHYSKRQG